MRGYCEVVTVDVTLEVPEVVIVDVTEVVADVDTVVVIDDTSHSTNRPSP